MLSRRGEPFPFEAVRDLLGIVRTIYAAGAARGAGARELSRIAVVGLALSEAYGMAATYAPGSVGWRAAWKKAEGAAAATADLIALTDEARTLVLAAAARVHRGGR